MKTQSKVKITKYPSKLCPLLPERSYHIFGRTNNRELLFKNNANYYFFLERLRKYILPVSDLYSYCLLPNHYHLLLKIRSEEEIKKFSKSKEVDYSKVISEQFRKCFISYTKAFNKAHGRFGNLLQRPFKRKVVVDEGHFLTLILYIHRNPVKHELTLDPAKYKWCSYAGIISDKKTIVNKNEVIGLFDTVEKLKKAHNQEIKNGNILMEM